MALHKQQTLTTRRTTSRTCKYQNPKFPIAINDGALISTPGRRGATRTPHTYINAAC